MSFAVTPTQGFAPPEGDASPSFIQFQRGGVNLGGPDADTLDFAGGLSATRGTGENENVVTVTADGGAGLAWRVAIANATVAAGDINNGIRMTAGSGSPTLLVDDGVIGEGESVLVAVTGDVASITVIGTANLVYPTARFQNKINGLGGVGTLIGLENGDVLLCGDLLAAA